MSGRLHLRLFVHSMISDWNHGNAHFLRGLARSLVRMGHEVRCYEEEGAWSAASLRRFEGERAAEAVAQFHRTYPEIDVRFYRRDDEAAFDAWLDEELRGADVVLVHEWNDPAFANRVLAKKDRFGFRAVFHDTHHRAYSNPREILRFDLARFDGVLAFGEALRRVYAEAFHVPHAWSFHEAADPEVFRPLDRARTADVLWVGNWGDEERTRELEEFLIGPAAALRGERRVVVHGVRYPDEGRRKLAEAGVEYRGYLPNLSAPEAYASSLLSLHVPRRQYANGLSGIPTIRVFEALACGVPLVCSPWTDAEGLFREGEDYLCVEDGARMLSTLRELFGDAAARRQIGESGRAAVLARHTCAHRARQLIEALEEIA